MFTKVHGHYQAHKITLAGIDSDAFTRSLTSARVQMNPHQVEAALFALKSPLSKGVLLADEVGLGKTIEAGLVLSQRWAEHRRRIILIVPASLRKQWQQELHEKFSLHSEIVESSTYAAMRKAGHTQPFACVKGIVICSYEFAARKADELRSIKWDLVVFDEAHRLRNVYKKDGSTRAKELKIALQDRFKILLTATPLQNSLMELYGIVSVVDENHFGGENAFRAQYMSASPTTLDALRERLMPVCQRSLRSQVQAAGHISFVRRNAQTFHFEPSSSEQQLYEELSHFLQREDTVSYGAKANQLVILQIRKILGSSSFAVARYLETLIERLKARKAAALSMTDDVDVMVEIAEEADEDIGEDEAVSISPEDIQAEIEELKGYLALAESIEKNAKGEELLKQLPKVLDEIQGKGGARKAVIFTESVRTQNYLRNLLESHGYAGRIVLMNGSNSDEQSRKTYAAWLEMHKGTDKISGSKTADMKAAIVEAFKGDDKTILIATESGAEGINLQFCSLLINFDLPWNPQRVEQRIGRCHRYGQKIDVTVVNMLNLKNKTEQRIHELLSQKFHLFEGVFGASDNVLGALMSGVDFEKEVLRIVQQGRTPEQIEAEFDALRATIQDKIDAEFDAARNKLLGEMDSTVIAKLQDRGKELDRILPEYVQRLLMVAHAELDGAHFDSPGAETFRYDSKTYTTKWPLADEQDWQFFRVNDGLGAELVERAKDRDLSTEQIAMTFRPDDYPFAGQVGAVKELKGARGWMRVYKATMPTPDALREELLIACLSDDGTTIDAAVADKIFMVPAVDNQAGYVTPPDAALTAIEQNQFSDFSDRVLKENGEWIDAESERLDRYAKDLEIELDAQIADLDGEVRELRKQSRAAGISMDEKLASKRKIKRLEDNVDEIKLAKFAKRKEARQKVEDMLDEFAEQLNQKPTVKPLMTVRWAVE
ncbi:SNF2-related protein [Novosphingobium capsulatum]|uniref:SNF2-related protein n=1 Tax=Novosphingobium capsulatum TaxID=13688 RepID=UPI0007881301|nr:SNF2-related protein [Novosphingobium capsulatum]WQD92797.1 SNF2-related protein [Novosphingobium capsulatum]